MRERRDREKEREGETKERKREGEKRRICSGKESRKGLR